MKPHKIRRKFSFVVGFFVLLVGAVLGGYFVLQSKSGSASLSRQITQILDKGTEPIVGCQPNPDDKTKDSDQDGLKDWEEIIWKTDSCKPDTDEDGYFDGEEVLSGYNPLIPAPNDELADRESTAPRPLPNNLTQALSQELFQKILAGEIEPIDESDLSFLNPDNYSVVNEAMQQTIQAAVKDFSLPYISDEEIKISPEQGKQAVENYGKKITETMDKKARETQIDQGEKFESELHLFNVAISSQNFADIDKYIKFYQGLYEDIKQIPAPAEIKTIHKEQLGIFWVMANIYKAIRNAENDPIKASLALEQYKIVDELSSQLVQKIVNYLQAL